MHIAIVFGGKSVEHDVSVVTAKQMHNICKDMYDISLIYIDKNGAFNLYTNHMFEMADFKEPQKNIKPITLHNGCIIKKCAIGYIKGKKIDCAIMCTHGGDGENGTLSSAFISAKIPVTCGSGVALGISMNKWLSKMFFKANKINHVKGLYANAQSDVEKLDDTIKKEFGYPVIVKANGGGSSIGIKTATNLEELKIALQVALEFDSSAVIEQQMQNFTEYNCAVFGDEQDLQVSKIDEPIKNEQILSFADKYLNSTNANKSNKQKLNNKNYPQLETWLINKIQTISKQIFLHLGFYGVIRIDYIYTPDDKKLYVNEINAIPGSLASYYFANNKIEYSLFIEKLVNLGIKNYNETFNINKNYITKLF